MADTPTYMGRPLPQPREGEWAKEVKDAYKVIQPIINSMDERKAHQLAYALANDHRTLVQSTMRDFILPFLYWLKHDADAKFYDARNEGATKLAALLVETFEDSNIGLPFI